MSPILAILLIIVCVILAFMVLIQNPKGGGLSGSFGGISTQMMGVQQSTDQVEKGTWILAAVMVLLCMLTFILNPNKKSNKVEKTRSEQVMKNLNVQAPVAPVQNAQPTNAAQPAQNGQQAQPVQNAQPAQQTAPAKPAK